MKIARIAFTEDLRPDADPSFAEALKEVAAFDGIMPDDWTDDEEEERRELVAAAVKPRRLQ